MLDLQSRISELLSEAERQACDPNELEVVLDLAELSVISSQFINELIRINLRLRMTDRRMLLVNVEPPVCEVLRLLRLDRTFEYIPIAVCNENGQESAVLKHRIDAAEKSGNYFLRRFAARFALRSLP